MENIMADNYLTQLLTNMQSQLNRLEEKVDASNSISKEAIELSREAKDKSKEVSSRLSTFENNFPGKLEKKDMPTSPLQNQKVVMTLFYLALSILLIVAAAVGLDVKAFL